MKKWMCVILAAMMLTGCSAAPTFETLGNVDHLDPDIPAPREIALILPDDAMQPVIASGADQLYVCEAYTISVQTMASGDLSATVQSISGFSPEQLTILESRCGDHDRLDWVWTAAAEGGDAMCRAALLDDGIFHYTLCVTASAEAAGTLNEQWNALFGSFCLKEME